jgi:hypothetical protein
VSITALILFSIALSVIGFLLWKLGDPDVSDRISASVRARLAPFSTLMQASWCCWFTIDKMFRHQWIWAAIFGFASAFVVASWINARRKLKT